MPRAPFPQELMKWLGQHVEAGDISRDTAYNLWRIARKDFPKVNYYPNRKGRPKAPFYAIHFPGLDVDRNICFGEDIIKQYLIKNPPSTVYQWAQFATVLKDSGCWRKNSTDKYVPIKSIHETLARMMKDIGLDPILYEPFTQALKDIEEKLDGSYPDDARHKDVMKFGEYLKIAIAKTREKELPDDYPPEF